MSFDQMAAQDDERDAVVAYLQKRRSKLKALYEVAKNKKGGGPVRSGLPAMVIDQAMVVLDIQIELLKELAMEFSHSKHHEKI